MANILYQEKQSFRQLWLWVLFAILNGLILWGLVQQLFLETPFGNNPMSNTGLLISALLMLLFNLFFFLMQLQTRITEEGINIRFYPVQKHERLYKWSEIKEIYVRDYKALCEYGGWGIRTGAYTVSGKKGLQLIFKNGEKLLIGTNKEEEMKRLVSALQTKGIIA
jgi:hypothetical protein